MSEKDNERWSKYISLHYKEKEGSGTLTGLMFGDKFFGHYDEESKQLIEVLADDETPLEVSYTIVL